MSLEDSMEEVLATTPASDSAPVDAFEAALAATSAPIEEVVVEEEVIAEVEATSEIDALDSEEAEDDENAEFRRALRNAVGDWYVVHSYAGYEKKVKGNLANRIHTLNMEDFIFQIEVPEEEVMEIKNGQRKQVKRNIYPGYVLVRMELSDESWSAVRNTPGLSLIHI